MTKPKNPPYIEALLDCKDGVDALKKAYAAGLRDREKRIARALRRWMNKKLREEDGSYQSPSARLLDYWLTARLRKGKK